MSVSNLTNGCKDATVQTANLSLTVSLTPRQCIQAEVALDAHISDLEQREESAPGVWTEELEAARQALDVLRRA